MSASSNLDRTLLALSDPTRRAILKRLARGSARVTDLAKPMTMSLNAVSKHIRMLERAQLVQRRRSGREHVLSFNPAPLDRAAEWIARQRAEWTARLEALETLLQAQDRGQDAPKIPRRKAPATRASRRPGSRSAGPPSPRLRRATFARQEREGWREAPEAPAGEKRAGVGPREQEKG